jgi:hypothetical protein
MWAYVILGLIGFIFGWLNKGKGKEKINVKQ